MPCCEKSGSPPARILRFSSPRCSSPARSRNTKRPRAFVLMRAKYAMSMHAEPGGQYTPKVTLTLRFARQRRPSKRKTLPSGPSRGSTVMQ
jgi:hypothetical protein